MGSPGRQATGKGLHRYKERRAILDRFGRPLTERGERPVIIIQPALLTDNGRALLTRWKIQPGLPPEGGGDFAKIMGEALKAQP